MARALAVALESCDRYALRASVDEGMHGHHMHIRALTHSTHPTTGCNLTVIGVLQDQRYFYIQMEYCSGGSLQSYLDSRKTAPSESEWWQICAALSSGAPRAPSARACFCGLHSACSRG